MARADGAAAGHHHVVGAAMIVLLVITGVMLLALVTRTPLEVSLEVPPFALGPFLGASLAIGAAALDLIRRDARHGTALAVLFALTALVSFGPQKYADPAISRIWPAVIIGWCVLTVKRRWMARP